MNDINKIKIFKNPKSFSMCVKLFPRKDQNKRNRNRKNIMSNNMGEYKKISRYYFDTLVIFVRSTEYRKVFSPKPVSK